MSSSGGPDLFVVCKSCGSEVSPYITECPYCGSRLRKRAPKLGRPGASAGRRRLQAPHLPRLRRGEIPGIRADVRPWATIALLVASVAVSVLVRAGALTRLDVAIVAGPSAEGWRLLVAPFLYLNTGYAFGCLLAIGVFGWLLERRHGPLPVLLLFLVGGAGGMLAESGLAAEPLALGGNGAALALVAAWAVPDLLDRRRGRAIDGDLLGAGAFAAVLLLMPVATDQASVIAGAAGLVVGLAGGLALAARRLHSA